MNTLLPSRTISELPGTVRSTALSASTAATSTTAATTSAATSWKATTASATAAAAATTSSAGAAPEARETGSAAVTTGKLSATAAEIRIESPGNSFPAPLRRALGDSLAQTAIHKKSFVRVVARSSRGRFSNRRRRHFRIRLLIIESKVLEARVTTTTATAASATLTSTPRRSSRYGLLLQLQFPIERQRGNSVDRQLLRHFREAEHFYREIPIPWREVVKVITAILIGNGRNLLSPLNRGDLRTRNRLARSANRSILRGGCP